MRAMIIVAFIICSLLCIISDAFALSIRSQDGTAENPGQCKLTVAVRLANSTSVKVTATADKATSINIKDSSGATIKACTNALSCSGVWLKRSMKAGENTVTSSTPCASITSYVDN